MDKNQSELSIKMNQTFQASSESLQRKLTFPLSLPLKGLDKINLEKKRVKPIIKFEFDSTNPYDNDEEDEISEHNSFDLSLGSFDENDNKKHIKINTVKCKMEIKLIRAIIVKNNWIEVTDETANIYWTSLALQTNEYKIGLRNNKFVSRLPGMSEIAQKKITGFILNKYQSFYPEEYKFFPKTFLLPEQLNVFKNYFNSVTNEVFIAKPTNGLQGDGIILIHSLGDLPNFDLLKKTNSKYTEYVVQKYIENPLLIEKKKFDLRLYILVSSIEPYICYLNEEGLARFCTHEYKSPTKKNKKNSYMHLSNYSLNKNSDCFKQSDEISEINDGSKRTLQSFWKSLEASGYKKDDLMKPTERLIKKFMTAIYPFLHFSYENIFRGKKLNSFHVIGMDILYDENLNPFLMEINSNPSLSVTTPVNNGKKGEAKVSPIDMFVKEKVVEDAIKIVINPIDKQMDLGLENWYNSYKQVINSEIEPIQEDIFIKIKDLYSKIIMGSKDNYINLNKFAKITSLLKVVNEEVTKADYFLIYQKINMGKTKTSINIYKFFYALELIAEKLYPNVEEESKLEQLHKLVDVLNELVV